MLVAPYVAGAGPDQLQAQRARAARVVGVMRDAVRETLQRVPAPICYADVASPQTFPGYAVAGLGLPDAAVGIQTGAIHLPGRLPPGVVI